MESRDSTAEKPVSTGIRTLDSLLDGGLPRHRAVLLIGTPGTGKSTLGMQYLQQGLRQGEGCLFISTEQTLDELRDTFQPFNFDLEHERLTITSIHASAGRTFESEDDELVISTFEDGELFGQGFSAPFESSRIRDVLDRYGPCDRVVVDSISGLEPMADDRDVFRRGILDLIRLFSAEFGATSLFTTERIGGSQHVRGVETVPLSDSVQYNMHGVIRLWRERIKGDYRRFLDVMKMRGVDHDTRQFEIQFDDSGVVTVPRRRVHSTEFVTHDHLQTGIDGFDDLGGGGILKGTGALVEHDGHANLDALLTAIIASAVEAERTITLVPTVDMKRERLAEMLRSQTGGEVETLTPLFERDQLFVLDATGAWSEEANVYDLQREDAGLRYLLRQINDESSFGGQTALFNTEAVVHAIGEQDARSIRYWIEANFLESDGVFLDIHNPNVMSESLAAFYEDAANQIFSTWLEETGLQYVQVTKSPTGEVGLSRLVEFVDRPPFVTVR